MAARRRRAPASSGEQRNATVGPEPESHPHQAPPARPAASASRDAGARAKRASWCRRSSVAWRSRSMSPDIRLATNTATRPRLCTASTRRTSPGSTSRDCDVDVLVDGIHNTTAGSMASGSGTTRSPLVTTTPPYTEAALLSAWPSSSALTAITSPRAASKRSRSPPARSATASAAPPTRIAPLKPMPRPAGIGDSTHRWRAPPTRR